MKLTRKEKWIIRKIRDLEKSDLTTQVLDQPIEELAEQAVKEIDQDFNQAIWKQGLRNRNRTGLQTSLKLYTEDSQIQVRRIKDGSFQIRDIAEERTWFADEPERAIRIIQLNYPKITGVDL